MPKITQAWECTRHLIEETRTLCERAREVTQHVSATDRAAKPIAELIELELQSLERLELILLNNLEVEVLEEHER